MSNFFENLPPDQALAAARQLRQEILEMKQQQRDYLDRRTAVSWRGRPTRRTATDHLLEKQQVTMQRMLDLIEIMEREYLKNLP